MYVIMILGKRYEEKRYLVYVLVIILLLLVKTFYNQWVSAFNNHPKVVTITQWNVSINETSH